MLPENQFRCVLTCGWDLVTATLTDVSALEFIEAVMHGRHTVGVLVEDGSLLLAGFVVGQGTSRVLPRLPNDWHPSGWSGSGVFW